MANSAFEGGGGGSSGGGTGIALSITVLQAAHGFTKVGGPIANTGSFVPADISDPAKYCVGLIETITNANTFTYVPTGALTLLAAEWDAVCGTTGGLPAGTVFYLGTPSGTDGTMTSTPLSAYRQPLMHAINTLEALVDRGDMVGITSTRGLDAVSVYNVATQSFGVTNNYFKYTYTTVAYDTNSMWDATNNRILIRRSGLYYVSAHRRVESSVQIQPAIRKNVAGTFVLQGVHNTTSYDNQAIGYIMLNAGDYVESWGWSTAAATHSAGDGYNFQAVGPFIST